MNIFVTSPDPAECAAALADAHVVKMAVETAQILSSALHRMGITSRSGVGEKEATGLALGGCFYKPTHTGHPCVMWAARDPRNFGWLVKHGIFLCAEYSRRFGGKRHGSLDVIECAAEVAMRLPGYSSEHPSAFARVFPDAFDDAIDVHSGYRAYLKAKYQSWPESRQRWTNSQRPAWSL